MSNEILVKDAMRRRVLTISLKESVLNAAIKMRKEGVGSLIVMKDKKPVGIITREDISDKIAAEDRKASTVKVEEIMNQPLVSCLPEDDINKVSRLMVKYGYERIPVIKNNKLVGIISAREILKVAPVLIDVFKEHFEQESMPNIEETIDAGTCEICGNYSEELSKINDQWVCESCKEESE